MNLILYNKLNINITNIVRSYLLPSIKDILSIKNNNMKNLQRRTMILQSRLNLVYIIPYKNFKIVYKMKNGNFRYWTTEYL